MKQLTWKEFKNEVDCFLDTYSKRENVNVDVEQIKILYMDMVGFEGITCKISNGGDLIVES